jgi:hypothetical protein
MVLSVGFVIDKVTLELVFPQFFCLTIIISPIPHIQLCGIWGWTMGLLEAPVPKNVLAFHPKNRKSELQAMEFMLQC